METSYQLVSVCECTTRSRLKKQGVVALPLLVCSKYHRLAVHNYASIEVKNLARHVGRVVRGQEHIGRRKLIRLTWPLHRHLLAKLLNLLFGHGLYNQDRTNTNILFFLTFEEFGSDPMK